MKVTVYHRDNCLSGTGKVGEVAVVHTPCDNINEALEYAYHHTNNIHGSWSMGKTIECNGEVVNNEDFCGNVEYRGRYHVRKDGTVLGARSTMAGDVMVCGGGKYEVSLFGFKPLKDDIIIAA